MHVEQHSTEISGEAHGFATRRRARVPLFLLLFSVVLAVAVVPLAVFGALTLGDTREALVVSRQEQQMHLAAAAAARIDAFLDQEGREAVKLGESIGVMNQARSGATLPFLAEFLDETVVLVRFRPRTGRTSLAVAQDLVVGDELEATLERDAQLLFEQGAFHGPPSARDAVLSGPFALGPARILAVTVSAPVQRRGRLIGVYQQVAVFQQVWNEVADSVPPPMALFLLSPEGRLVARSRGTEIVATSRIREREIVTQFLGSRGRSRGARTYDVVTDDGESRAFLGSFSATSHSWGLFVEVEEDLALAPIHDLLQDIAFGGILAAGLAIGAALVLGGAISRPMARLAAISTRLASGDFSVRADASRVSELDALAGNFNLMSTRLGELVERFRAAARDANAMFLGTIRALAEAIDEKDPYTKGHSVRVNRYAVIIGRYLGLSREDIRALHVSALLHDVGKIGIDDSILKKPAALTADEFEVMKSHPERGAKIMGRIPQMKDIVPGMRFHHERWNGGGYPVGLKGEEIPLQARIVAVADTFDAMTTDRPYQRAFSEEDAAARINDLKGIGLDPEVVGAFNRAYEAGEFDEVIRTRPRYFKGDAEGGGKGDAPKPTLKPPAPAESVGPASQIPPEPAVEPPSAGTSVGPASQVEPKPSEEDGVVNGTRPIRIPVSSEDGG